jgi:hypothetical protein
MIAELLRDMKEDLRELPGVTIAIALAIMVGLGCNAEIFWHADGDGLRVSASREQSTSDQVERLHAKNCTAELTPGFTVLLGLRQYSVEVSVPIPVVRSFSEDVRANVAARCERRNESVA